MSWVTRTTVLVAAVCLVLALVGVSRAHAAGFGVTTFSSQPTNQDGSPATQAGAHPYEDATTIDFDTVVASFGEPIPDGGQVRDTIVDLPPGLIGNPAAFPTCTPPQLDSGFFGTDLDPLTFQSGPGIGCPLDSQVGTATIVQGGGQPTTTVPIFNMVAPPGEPAEFAFDLAGVDVPLDASVRPGGGLTITTANISEALEINAVTITFWGVPADSSHDAQRGTCILLGGTCSSTAPPVPFLTNPVDCSAGAMTTTLRTDSWTDPGDFLTETSGSPAVTGCDRLSFNPSLNVQPDSTQAGAPTGLSVDLGVPQTNNAVGLGTPELKTATVKLPAGMSISPGSADGLTACSDAQFDASTTSPAACAGSSQIGTVQITTPLLNQPLQGQVYLGQPQCGPCSATDAQDGKLFRLFIQAQGSGVVIKLPGTVTADPQTGQLTATFDQDPELPFSALHLELKSGARAPLANPTACGTYTTTSDLQPWSAPDSGPDATPSSTFDVTGCGSSGSAQTGFAPTLTAGSQSAQAGAYSPFTLTFSRQDSDQDFSGLTVKLPPGLEANLSAVPLCSDADANAGTCPADTQVGTATVAVGPGSEPLWLPQAGEPQPAVYLTGPYKGGPYGLVVETPADVGPFNLGTVVVRQALFIDPETAQVTVQSDPFPTIVDGVPLDIRTISVTMNRPDFTVNPTSCDPMAVTGTLTSVGGLSAALSSPFQVHGCQDIGFSPQLKIALTGKGKTRSGDHPTLNASLTDPAGQANIHNARVTLPLSLALDPKNSNNVCPYATAAAVHGGAVGCASSTIVGTATAVTPLLSQPLTGSVYLVQGLRCQTGQLSPQGTCANGQTPIHTLPSLLVPLRGQIALDLRAQSSVSGGKLVTTFPTIPDAPVSSFTLKINGGKKGILVVTGRGLNICQKEQLGNADFGAQSGATKARTMKLSTPCGAAPAVKVLSKKVSSGKVLLKVQSSQGGKVTVTGNQLTATSKTLKAGTHQITAKLKKSAAKRLAHAKRAAKMMIKVQLQPAAALPATRTLTVRM